MLTIIHEQPRRLALLMLTIIHQPRAMLVLWANQALALLRLLRLGLCLLLWASMASPCLVASPWPCTRPWSMVQWPVPRGHAPVAPALL